MAEIYFDTSKFLINLEKKANNQEINDNDYRIIDRLCKKIDVVKRIYNFYSADISTKKSNEEISVRLYMVLLKELQAEKYTDFKFLNSALKLNDILRARGYIELEDSRARNRKIVVTGFTKLYESIKFYDA